MTRDDHFYIGEARDNGTMTLSLAGELDLLSAPRLDERLREMRAEKLAVRLDLSGLEFVDSTGIHVLIDAMQRARDAGSRLEVDGRLSSQVSRVFQLVHMEHVLSGGAGAD